ncbi:MAG: PIN domain-containing protein [Chloroflexota bacterium]|nr:PIN domain-containing protein [Chloroflexota bacterium]
MRVTSDTTLFFDASVLVAGAHSEQGGSALLLDASKLAGFTAQLTSLVVVEANHVLEKDFPPPSLARFYDYLAQIDWDVLPVPAGETLQKYAPLVDPKDLHVLAAAVEGQSEFLLTLDRKHILAAAEAVQKANLPIRILTPGDFIQQYYPLHEAYSSLPSPRGSGSESGRATA